MKMKAKALHIITGLGIGGAEQQLRLLLLTAGALPAAIVLGGPPAKAATK